MTSNVRHGREIVSPHRPERVIHESQTPKGRATLPTESPTCVGKGRGAPVPDDDKLTNIRNVLGFLLAGFGALLSFLGIRSSENQYSTAQ